MPSNDRIEKWTGSGWLMVGFETVKPNDVVRYKMTKTPYRVESAPEPCEPLGNYQFIASAAGRKLLVSKFSDVREYTEPVEPTEVKSGKHKEKDKEKAAS